MPIAKLWNESDGEWNASPLNGDLVALGAGEHVAAAATLARIVRDHQDHWALIVGANEHVRVNGECVTPGIRALNNRDAIQIGGGERLFFATESGPVAAPYQGVAPVPCARCSSDIRPGQLAVRCPGCGTVMHQGELECFTYADRCVCGQPTALNDDNCWRPDEI